MHVGLVLLVSRYTFFLQYFRNITFLQVLSRTILVEEAMDHFLWKRKEPCVCLTDVGSHNEIVSTSNRVFRSLYFFMRVVPTKYQHLSG